MTRRLKVCLISPKFEPSYWGFEYALPLYPGMGAPVSVPAIKRGWTGLAGWLIQSLALKLEKTYWNRA